MTKGIANMTVEQLIEILQKFDPKKSVVLNYREEIQCVVECSEQIYVDPNYDAGKVKYINIISQDWIG